MYTFNVINKTVCMLQPHYLSVGRHLSVNINFEKTKFSAVSYCSD